MKNMYSIYIEFSPVYECITSFYAYTHQKEVKSYFLEPAWREKTKQLLPASFAAELEDERWEVLHRIVLLAAQSPRKETVGEFLDWLGSLPAGEMYERMAPWVDSIPLNLGEIRDRSLRLLSSWNEHYFSRQEQAVLASLKESAGYLRERAKSIEAPFLIDEATNGIWIEPTESLKRVVLVPQAHCTPTTILDFYRGMATVLYPVIDGEIVKQNPVRQLLATTQCLADEKRLLILRTLAQKTCTLSELQAAVGLAKSTVHHHVTALRRAGLIRAHYADSTTVQGYSIRDAVFAKLPDMLSQYFYDGGSER
ncbi:ArsR family transcriptional regulator [Brevibacillus borstelensis]|jgi:DNA-binding transcriptional ArsR family regulator|uniref:ArsR/SmtB family transcription factor n=1 Tax=Brevibacillus borstelensis TaxID=45462 RepID=UPI000F07DF64|nr:winged helix-turn-helix domain-containing protein [Brevibacillus borstelensis]MBE5394800.1 winged helix-turn-helix transcriptional regulator [Brevibacillus borstelensis]MCM3592760.1 winged helix-turn-helix domain-containing protein [Brevibacillus borstelensis]MED1744038.1 winged helix-turn-helix domain-containing protein [Brevibacillus borstelensis]MED1873988.1 winged helix-turn-helix domain-containing protein [Brevibacillus borstelensis]MED1885785.1 winged helix-turn-helix domain-containin